jgi:hypothetical protein
MGNKPEIKSLIQPIKKKSQKRRKATGGGSTEKDSKNLIRFKIRAEAVA